MPRPLRHHIVTGLLGLGAIGSLAFTVVLPGAPASAQISVFDPSNYSQNLLTAARTLSQVNNQIRSLQNEAQMLAGQAKNLARIDFRSEEHTSELQSLMRISYAVFCLKK